MNVWMKIFYGVLHFTYCIYPSTVVQYEYWEKVFDVEDAPEHCFFMTEDIHLLSQCAVLCTQDALCQSFEKKVIENSGFQCGLMNFIVYHCQPSEQVYIKVYIFVTGLIQTARFDLQIMCYLFRYCWIHGDL